MYDDIRMRLPMKTDTPDIKQYLDGYSESLDTKTGMIKTYGSLGNLKVNIRGDIQIIGSLAKFLYSSNIYPLKPDSTKEAIEKLSDSLHLDIGDAKITLIEFGDTFVMKHPPQDYYHCLGDMPRLQRSTLGSSLYYKPEGREQSRTFKFYDKMGEVKDDVRKGRYKLPDGFEDANLLRYEMTLRGRLPRRLGVPEVTASTLSEKDFYRMMMRRYQKSYFSISENKRFNPDCMRKNMSVTEAFDVLVAQLLEHSDPDVVSNYIEDLKRCEAFPDPKYLSRFKNKIGKVKNKAVATEPDPLKKELDDAIKNIGAFV